MKRTCVRMCVLAVLVLAWMWPATAAMAEPAAPLADKLPGGSLLYVGWGGAGPNRAALDATGVARLLNDPEIEPHVRSMVTQLEAFVRKQAERELPPGAYGSIRSLLLDVVWDRPWALAVIDVKMPSEEVPAPVVEVALVADLGAKADAAMGHVNGLIDKFLPQRMKEKILSDQVRTAAMKSLAVEEDAPPILWGLHKRHLIVAVSRAAAEKVVALIDGPGKALSADPQFAKVSGKLGGGLLSVYADVARFRKDLLPTILAMTVRDQEEIAQINKIVSALGLDAIDALGLSVRPDGAEFLRQCYVLAPRGKPGLLVLADQKPVPPALLATVPGDATFAIVGNFNRVKIIDELERQLAKFPEAQQFYNETRKSLEETIGLDLKTDLAAAIGDGVAVYNSPSAGGFLFTGLTGVAEVRDHAKLKAVLPKLETALLKQLGQLDPDIVEMLAFKSARFKNYDYRYTVTTGVPMPFAPAWCLTQKYLVFSVFPQSLKAALLQIEKGKAGSLLANDWLARQLAGSAKGATVISYVNQRQLMRIAYPIALPLWQVACSMAGKVGVQLDVNALPRQRLLLEHLGDSLGAMIPDDEGVLLTGRSSTPLPSILSAVTIAPMMAAPAAILLPVVAQGMGARRRVQSATNLFGLGKTMQIYASDHDGKYPDSLQAVVDAKLTSPKTLVSPAQKGPGWSYIYIKPADPNAPNSTRIMVAYEKPENYNHSGTNVLFLDGHVRWMSMARLKRLLAETKQKKPGAANPPPANF